MIDYRYIDMHCHLDFAARADNLARKAHELGIAAFSTTVTPEGYLQARNLFAACNNIAVGLGLHPWWEHERLEERLDAFGRLAPTSSFIGEVGLDFSKRCAVEPDEQVKAFRRLLAACSQSCGAADAGDSDGNSGSCSKGGSDGSPDDGSDGNSDDGSNGGKLFSIHAIQSVTAVLDLLEEAGIVAPEGTGKHAVKPNRYTDANGGAPDGYTTGNYAMSDDDTTNKDDASDDRVFQRSSVILHWFSGSSDELSRAIKRGCFFSVGPHMLKSKRGREYARIIPLKQLLFETDEPAEGSTTWSAQRWQDALEETCVSIASLRHIEPEELRTTVAQTSRNLLRQYGLP